MGWLGGRYLLAVPVGAIGGAMAYYAGASLGALTLNGTWGLLAVAAEWAVALPALVYLNAALRRGGIDPESPLFAQEAV